VLTCPNDLNNFQQPYGLSYALNAGYGNFPVTFVNGVRLPAKRRITNLGFHSASTSAGRRENTFPNTTGVDADVARDTGIAWRDLRSYSGVAPYSQASQFRMTLEPHFAPRRSGAER